MGESVTFIVIDASIPEKNLSENFFRLNKTTVSNYKMEKKKTEVPCHPFLCIHIYHLYCLTAEKY